MANQSRLSDFHRSNGAVFAESDGRILPARFGEPAKEYHAVRSTAGLLDLSHRGLLQFTGPDRLAFLQGMLSNDLRALTPFEGQHAAILTQQGKVIADVRVLCAMNSFYLDFWANLKEKLITHLNRYLVADEVEIADRTDEYVILSVQGPRSSALLKALASDAQLPEHAKQHAMAQIDGSAVCVVRDSAVVETGYDLIVPAVNVVDIARKLTDTGKQFAAAWIGTEAENVLRVEAGVPRYGVDFNEDNLLLEVGLDDAISFSKGCYLGQEVVERIRSRGHVNKKLCGLLLDGRSPADAGTSLAADGKEVGKITSSVFSPKLDRPVALGYVAKQYWNPGTMLSLGLSSSAVQGVVTELPFTRSS
jgi:folate-binding protein YgfZ